MIIFLFIVLVGNNFIIFLLVTQKSRKKVKNVTDYGLERNDDKMMTKNSSSQNIFTKKIKVIELVYF